MFELKSRVSMSITPNKISRLLSHGLGREVQVISLTKLNESSREAPYRIDVQLNGHPRSLVMRCDQRGVGREFSILQALEPLPIKVPQVYIADLEGTTFGVPCFFCDFVEGEPLLNCVLAAELWAEELFIETVITLQSITRKQLKSAADFIEGQETALDILETAYLFFKKQPHPIADHAYNQLKQTLPQLPETRFSNGDLWLENLIVKDNQLSGIIDFEQAGFSDPIYEFLLSFFLKPELQKRGIEEKYCRRMGFDPDLLQWYRGLEFFDSLHWVIRLNETYGEHTAESLCRDLEIWLDHQSKY